MTEENVIQINGGITINVDVSLKKARYVKKSVWNPATCNSENGKYLVSIKDDSAIICDEVIDAEAKLSLKDNDETISIPNFNEKNATCKKEHFYNFTIFTYIFIKYYFIIDNC